MIRVEGTVIALKRRPCAGSTAEPAPLLRGSAQVEAELPREDDAARPLDLDPTPAAAGAPRRAAATAGVGR